MRLLNIMGRLAPSKLVLCLLVLFLVACATQEDGPDSRTSTVDPISDPEHAVNPPPEEEKIEPYRADDSDLESREAIDSAALVVNQVPATVAVGKQAHRDRNESLMGTADMAYPVPCCPGNIYHPVEPLDRENYGEIIPNPLRLVAEQPVSTFSIDVDTGAYSNVRRILNEGRLPPQDAVRVEELINYFDYDYPVPDSRDRPFAVRTEVATAPWNPDRLLLQVGIKGYEVPAAERKSANLVFLIDVSGSMRDDRKLPLLKQSMKLLTRQLNEDDRVSLVVYAGAAGVVLEPTPGDEHAKINAALARLAAGGSTNGAGGIRAAYEMAQQGFVRGGINRIMLATDGDFNVGTVDFDTLIDLVEREREAGISLTTLGFGAGNYNDHLMEQLADAGNGNHAYIDNLNEGRKVLVEQLSSTLQTIAKDVKIQVEFNPDVVAEYRLIGYENRMLRREDFNNDKIDAGEIGAGHTVTALYELALVGSEGQLIDPLRYGESKRKRRSNNEEVAFVRLRYKAPEGKISKLIEQPVRLPGKRRDYEPSAELRFAAAVAGFGQILRGGEYLQDFGYNDVIDLARDARGDDHDGYRGEFLNLVRLADSLATLGSQEPQARR